MHSPYNYVGIILFEKNKIRINDCTLNESLNTETKNWERKGKTDNRLILGIAETLQRQSLFLLIILRFPKDQQIFQTY